MAVAYRGFTRIAGAFLFVSSMTLSAPLALAAEQAKPEGIPNGLLCTDQMLTEPGYDDFDPTEVSDTLNSAKADGAASNGGVCDVGATIAV